MDWLSWILLGVACGVGVIAVTRRPPPGPPPANNVLRIDLADRD